MLFHHQGMDLIIEILISIIRETFKNFNSFLNLEYSYHIELKKSTNFIDLRIRVDSFILNIHLEFNKFIGKVRELFLKSSFSS